MEYCKNHPKRNFSYRCTLCSEPVCGECFRERLILNKRKKLGFCSDICIEEYLRLKKLNRSKNRKKSLYRLVASIGAFSTALVLMRRQLPNSFHDKDTFFIWIDGIFIRAMTYGFFLLGISSLIIFISAIIKGDDPDVF